MKPGPKRAKVPANMAISIGNRVEAIANALKTDPATPDLIAELTTLGRWLNGKDRKTDPVLPFMKPKPVKPATRTRAYSDATKSDIALIAGMLMEGMILRKACKALGVEVKRFERYMVAEGYGEIIKRNERAHALKAAEASRLKTKPVRATFLPARAVDER